MNAHLLYSRRTAPLRGLIAAAVVALLAGPGLAHADEHVWNYKSYKKARSGGSFDANNFVTGTLTLDEKPGGQATVTISAGFIEACYSGALPATVSRTDTQTVIEVPPRMPGCEHYRYVIRNDGSGGARETKRGDGWVNGRFDHDLTAKK